MRIRHWIKEKVELMEKAVKVLKEVRKEQMGKGVRRRLRLRTWMR